MQIFKTKAFHRWALKEGVEDSALCCAINEIALGLVDAELGGHVFKKRVPIPGRGKSGGARTLLAFRHEDKAFFMYGFAKNQRANIKDDELEALKKYAKVLLALSDQDLTNACKEVALYKVECDG